MRNSPQEAVRINSNMFDIFGLARQIPRCENRAKLGHSSIQQKYMACSRDFSGVGISSSDNMMNS